MTVKKTTAKPTKSTTKTPTRKPKAKPKAATVKHPFGTCVPLGECVCSEKGN